MTDPNPYSPTDADPRALLEQPRSEFRRLLLGAAIGAALPLLFGGYGLYQSWEYAASLPPGSAACGNAGLGPLVMIVFVAPFLGMIGGGIALFLP
ncbi:hypothetical protein K227x_28610 [Rubripirellula lacrimiformis]|uniref:Uncharacterized protein n=1 Tax=Rubripirellula lacrimiformis TaxID=1930273 RepID=A0A517NBH7_9BACT|nr:hypothetical protein [Rubripirellula lacrimiformis]QDT04470.1 hypothetical protein K227x_28610 [Rubripirellula lacrimiformis]